MNSLENILDIMNFPNLAVFKIQPEQRRNIFLKYLQQTLFFFLSSTSGFIGMLWSKLQYLILAKSDLD